MTVIKRDGYFVIYFPQTKEDKLKGNHPQVKVDAVGLTTYTHAALERLAKRSHKRIDRKQRELAARHSD